MKNFRFFKARRGSGKDHSQIFWRGLWSEGETSPALFITGFNDNEDKKEYDALSKKYNIRFCGNID